MLDLVLRYLKLCHSSYPSYQERTIEDIPDLAKLYCAVFNDFNLSKDDVEIAFRWWLGKGEPRFPLAADIVKLAENKPVYRFDHGPQGYGGLYTEDHWYTKQQIRVGTDVSQYATTCSASEYRALTREAMAAIEPPEQHDESPTIEDRRGGWSRIEFNGEVS